jgi:hypothetical protein
MVAMYPDITHREFTDKFQRMAHKGWLDILRIFNGPSYECHQRYSVFIDCFAYGLPYGESFDCARTCNNLPEIIFEVVINA